MAIIVDPPQTLEDVHRYVRRSLGEGVIDVELQVDQLNDAVTSALLWWQGIVGWYREATVKVQPQGGDFDVPEDCQEVSHVFFEDGRDKILDIFDWAGVELAPVGYGSYFSTPSGAYRYIHQFSAYIEEGKKIVSVDPDWGYIRDTRKLRIFAGNNRTATAAIRLNHPLPVINFSACRKIRPLNKLKKVFNRRFRIIN